MQLIFDSVDEVKNFVANELKKGRASKGGNDDGETGGANTGNLPGNGQAPPPQMPNAQQLQQAAQGGAFPGAGATVGQSAAPGAFPGGGQAPGIDPNVAGLVQRIAARVDGALQSGQSPDGITQWLRNACAQVDPSAAGADLATLKATYLLKMPVQALDAMAKQMNA